MRGKGKSSLDGHPSLPFPYFLSASSCFFLGGWGEGRQGLSV